MEAGTIKNIVIVGGGSAGWLTAGVIAAAHKSNHPNGLQVTLIESPDTPIIGVGEGTWPSMRTTLSKIGVSETELFRECDASFKQGIKFVGWVTGKTDDYYYHPLVLPQGFSETDLVLPWQQQRNEISFGDAICYQGYLCERNLAPKQITTPEYASVANYAYHFNAVKLGQFLRKHCVEKLGVRHISDHVTAVKSADDGDISALTTKMHGDLAGDLFIDCSGSASLLLGNHFQVPFISKKHILFNDAAIAVQVPYPAEDSPIASHTTATAKSAGWIWDIGLPTRRGLGYVYSTAHIDAETVERELREHIQPSITKEVLDSLSFRKISYDPGYRKEFWHRNCVAVGMSSGFIEPLEATALVMVEAAASMISNELPASKEVMGIVAKRFNQRFTYYWDTMIDFVKLQYALTKRTDTEYWIDNTKAESIPERLHELLSLWRHQPPNKYDFPLAEEMLPAASWQYILYGMGFVTENRTTETHFNNAQNFQKFSDEAKALAAKYCMHLPTNRELIQKINLYGLQKI
ncbi:MAG: tryptophan halogenase family protein [Pseudomonadota bacterium]